jgi:hypothetical protein
MTQADAELFYKWIIATYGEPLDTMPNLLALATFPFTDRPRPKEESKTPRK